MEIPKDGPTSTKRMVPIPPGCRGLLFGKKGSAIKTLKDDIVSQLKGPHWGEELLGSDACPSLHLHADNHTLTVTIKWTLPWRRGIAEPERVRNAATSVQQSLLHRMKEIRCFQLEKSYERRERKRELLRKAGQEYHALRRKHRDERRNRPMDSIERALTLPPAGLTRAHVGGRKGLLRHRRRTFQWEKRQSLLHACGVLEQAYRLPHGCSAATTHSTGCPTSQPCNQERFQKLMNSSHLSRLCIPSRPRAKQSVHDRCMPGAVNRLRRQVKAIADVADVPIAVQGLAGRRKKLGHQQPKHLCSNHVADLVEGLDICEGLAEKKNWATIYMESSMARSRTEAENTAVQLAGRPVPMDMVAQFLGTCCT